MNWAKIDSILLICSNKWFLKLHQSWITIYFPATSGCMRERMDLITDWQAKSHQCDDLRSDVTRVTAHQQSNEAAIITCDWVSSWRMMRLPLSQLADKSCDAVRGPETRFCSCTFDRLAHWLVATFSLQTPFHFREHGSNWFIVFRVNKHEFLDFTPLTLLHCWNRILRTIPCHHVT